MSRKLTPAEASRRNGRKGGRPRKGGTGVQRRLSRPAEMALAAIIEAQPEVSTHGEALDLLLENKSVKFVLGLLTRKPG